MEEGKQIKWTVKIHGKVYEVRPTGRIVKKKAKSYYDFNGNYTEKEASERVQLGIYNDQDELIWTCTEDGRVFSRTDGKYQGKVNFRTK